MHGAIRSLSKSLSGERAAFVGISLVVNLVLCLRSYVTMQALDYRGLGLAALLQSIVLLISMVQFGFLNGGYRLLCSADDGEARRINDLIFTLMALLSIVTTAVVLGALPFLPPDGSGLVTVLGALGGVTTLARTWMMNHMIARGSLARLNRINLWSAIASLAPLGLIPIDPLAACLLAVVAQPIAFVAAAAILDRSLLPRRLEWSLPLARAVLGAGFVMFLIGIFLQINLQLERWYVTALLGLDALGHLYLALLFVTLFQMVPTSLDQVFLPQVVRAHAANDTPAMHGGIRQFFVVQFAYCLAATAAVAFLARPVTALILPEYLGDLTYLYILAPGIILFTLSGPFSILFNVLLKFRTYFVAYGLGTALTAVALLAAGVAGGALDLEEVMILRSVVYGIMGVILVAGFHLVTARIPGLGFRSRTSRGPGV